MEKPEQIKELIDATINVLSEMKRQEVGLLCEGGQDEILTGLIESKIKIEQTVEVFSGSKENTCCQGEGECEKE